MEIRKFSKLDFEEYRSWFKNSALNTHLGPEPDQEWLNSVLTQKGGQNYSAILNKKLIGIIGVTFPNKTKLAYTVNEIAINPQFQKQGYGEKLVEEIFKIYPKQSWQAFIDIKNKDAQLFFEKINWKSDKIADEHNMLTFSFKDES